MATVTKALARTAAATSSATLYTVSLAVFDLKQVIPASGTPKTISGYASTTAVTIHISGVEIS